MIEVGFGLLASVPQEPAERIDFALEPGVILFAILFFVLVNVLLAAILYPYFTGSSSGEQKEEAASEEPVEPEPIEEEVAAERDEPLEERVDDFLEDIHEERGG